jgi:hypothetical protein
LAQPACQAGQSFRDLFSPDEFWRSSVVHGPQVEGDGAVTDLASVLNALFDGVTEVNANQDARERVLLSGL